MSRLNLLITGISGFIGRSLVEEIVNRNLPWNINGIDIKDPCFNDSKYLKNIVFDIVDIRDQKAVEAYFATKRFDGVIHLAAVSRVVDAEKNKENCIQTNLHGTKNVLDNVAKVSETWVIFGSSREVYGEQKEFPVKESSEKTPINIYGRCKLEGEMLVQKLIRRYMILRFSNVYGNNYDIKGRVIPAFVERALNEEPLYLEGGGQIIDFTHISDTTMCIINAAELLQSNVIEKEEIHICPGCENRITDIISYLSSCLNKELRVSVGGERSYDVKKFVGDPTKRKEILCDKEFISLRKGIMMLLELKKRCRNVESSFDLSTAGRSRR